MDSGVLAVLASDSRRKILRLTWDNEMSAGDLASRFDVSWPAVSQHLKVLKDAGLIVERRDGRSRLYTTDPAALGPLAALLEDMWRTDLDRLADIAEDEEKAGDAKD